MPGWPPPADQRLITFTLDPVQVLHLDSRAKYEGCSRSAYIRQLIVRDIERQGPAHMAAP